MKDLRRLSSDRRLYENLFLEHSPDEIFQLLSEGIIAFIENAERLYNDAQLLFKQGSWTSGRFLLTTANEEVAKSYILLDACRLDFSRHQSNLTKLCYAFYDHTYKYAYNNIISNPKIKDLKEAKNEWFESTEKWIPASENEDVKLIHETYFLREMPLYIDFLDHDQRWSTPKEDVAEYNYSMGVGLLDSESAILRLTKTQSYGLFSPVVLSLINDIFKKHYLSETITNEFLVDLHNKTAKKIEMQIGIPTTYYLLSSLDTIPLYHLLTLKNS